MTGPFGEAADSRTDRLLEWAAKAVCRSCPVLVECRAWALHHEVAGVCGGFTEGERERWRRDVGVEVEPTTTLPFLPIDIACRDLLDVGLPAEDIARLVVGRGYSPTAAADVVRRARSAFGYVAAPPEPPPPESETERRRRELADARAAS